MISIYRYINSLVNLQLIGKKVLIVKNSRIVMMLVKVLLNNSILCKYTLHNNSIICIIRYNNNTSVIKKVRYISKPSSKCFVSVKQIRMLEMYHYIGLYVVLTTKGLLTTKEAIAYNTGGILLLYISYV